MKKVSFKSLLQKSAAVLTLGFVSLQTWAEGNDLLADALTGNVQGSFGSGSMFWKIFILVDVIMATAMAVKTKNPMVFLGVAAIAFVPAFLIKTFVFP